MGNSNLTNAKRAKNDEFYTQLTDIEKELAHYKKHFEGKTVFCNCDDPFESNFFKYFALNFNHLKLKKLIATSYATSQIVGKEINLFTGQPDEEVVTKHAYKIVITELRDVTGDGREGIDDVKEIIKHRVRYLQGDGDFRSAECIELLKEADIVVTNPPFSLFREYVKQLVEYKKKFILLANMNAITYKEIFPLIKENKMWLGYGFNVSMVFSTPYANKLEANKKYVEARGYSADDGFVRVPALCWYTNLDIAKYHEPMILYKKFNEEDYPKYDNYSAYECSKVKDIPCDFNGILGVPITFLDKHCVEQFEIVGLDRYTAPKSVLIGGRLAINGKTTYARILIRRKDL